MGSYVAWSGRQSGAESRAGAQPPLLRPLPAAVTTASPLRSCRDWLPLPPPPTLCNSEEVPGERVNWKVPGGRLAFQLHHPLNCGAWGKRGPERPHCKESPPPILRHPFPHSQSVPPSRARAMRVCLSGSLVRSCLPVSLIFSVVPLPSCVFPTSCQPSSSAMGMRRSQAGLWTQAHQWHWA